MQAKQIHFLFLAIIFSFSVNAQSYEKQYDVCSESLKNLKIVDSIYFDLVKKRDSCLVGTSAPNFMASTIDNQELDLSKLRGHVVMLNFWFTRCQPCIKEMPDLNKLVDLYSRKKVVFISFAPEESDIIKEFLISHPFKFKTVAKSEAIRSEQFKLFSAWPYTILIDQEGKISKMILASPGENIVAYYQGLIDQLLK
jgi:thiol-disulfide isomerase/thioredoxin